MSTDRTLPWMRFSGSLNVIRFSLGSAMNRGWKWSVTTPDFLGDVRAMGLAISGATPPTYSMVIGGDRNKLLRTSPRLVASNEVAYELSENGELMTISGVDLTTWLLTRPNQSLKTFRNTQFNTIIQAIAVAAGVQIVAPTINLSVAEEDIKQSTWLDALARLAEVALMNIIIDANGVVRFVPLRWTAQACTFSPTQIRYSCDPSKFVTGLVINKRTSHYVTDTILNKPYAWNTAGVKVEQLKIPVANPSVQDLSTVGGIQEVSFWTDNPSNPAAQLIKQILFPPYNNPITTAIQTGTGVAKYMMVGVSEAAPGSGLETLEVSAKLLVSGSTPPTVAGFSLPNLDLSFTAKIGLLKGPGARPGPVRNESLWPSEAWVVGNQDEILWEVNKGALNISATGPIDFTSRVGGALTLQTYRNIPKARIESIDESGDCDSFTASIGAYPIPW